MHARLSGIEYEFKLFYLFTRSNLLIGVPPALLMSLSAMVREAGVARTWAVPEVVVFACFAIYVSDLSQQLTGIEEDRHNKPRRPLPAALVNPDRARRRLLFSVFALLLVSIPAGVILQALSWLLLSWLNDHMGLARNVLAKPVVVGFQAVVQLTAAWQITAPMQPAVFGWIILTGVVLALLMPLQDLRDIPGDLACGRRTLPIRLGQRAARSYLCVAFIAAPVIIYFVGWRLGASRLALLAFAAVQALMSVAVCVRLRGPINYRKDHVTYTVLVYWYMSMAVAPMLIF
ncbi:UbiA family prenyltransferase [Amycolatopsis sp. lyj-23]|uniref:UbiA family prenyltransferase n=1 Tax=Amycolatopsis sp. lyj-23 TaxID=2789283 RepID=UPI00397B0E4F